MAKTRAIRAYLLGISLWIGVVILALKLGAVPDASIELITEIRLPRVILASVIGVGLSVGGAALQALFANPLCEPYTLGISSGSALGAVLGLSLGLEWSYAGLVGTSFLGALLFAGILLYLSHRQGSNNITLLLAGVMLGFLGNSLVAIWIVLANSNGLQGALVWLFGDLSRARLSGSLIAGLGVGVLSLLIWTQSKNLDALLMGEEDARALGVDVRNVRRRVILLTSLLIGLCVSAAGMVGFVGLVVPHFARRWIGSLHFGLLPFCAICGGAVLTLSDSVARTAVSPYELPVGVITAFIGAPLFIWIMLKRNQVHEG
jgi:ABC-type Fe3+-siderophore transport system permease subunit